MPSPHPVRDLSPFTHTMGELVKGPVRTIAAEASVGEAARLMTVLGVGSLVVMGKGGPEGILTKTDLVSRVLAPERASTMRVSEVITPNPISIDRERPIFDGLLLMIRHDISHLLVTEQGRATGMASERDWLLLQKRHPAALVRELDQAPSVRDLAALREQILRRVRGMFAEEGTASALTEMMTEINDRVGRRVIALALAEMEGADGPPPAPFAWIAMGSEGRCEQTLSTDQDNALIFGDVPAGEEPAVQGWFLRLASRVVDGLEVCGFPRCKGNVMASNPGLCLPLAAWRDKFSGYLRVADEEAVLRAAIYFDFRRLYGEESLVSALWEHLLDHIDHSRGFLRHLAGQAMESRSPVDSLPWRLRAAFRLPQPPLDLKKQALAPLVASARVLALAAGSRRTHTLERVREALAAGLVPEPLAHSVINAYDFLMLLRLRRNFMDAGQGREPSNLVPVAELNPLQRQFLADSLREVMEFQHHVFYQYGGIS